MKHPPKNRLLFLTFIFSVTTSMAAESYVGYLYAYFSGDETRLDDQQIYFAVSKDGITWDDLNENNPVLVSTLGDCGVRDPYIIRSVTGDTFYLIATDLDIRASKYGGSWGLMSTAGSTSIMIWESTDLVNWSAQRMVNVSSGIGAGNTWAPEAIYDESIGQYLVYWSSRVSTDSYAMQRIYVSQTPDFVTFTAPKKFVETTNSCIDASILKVGNTYYRLIKDENILAVSLSSAESLQDTTNTTALGNSYTHITNTELESYTGGYEGPTMFQFNNEQKWCALVDEYTGSKRGYIPFISTDIAAANSLHLMSDGTYLMPTGAKHGTVIPITQAEYDSLVTKWAVSEPSETISATPELNYNFNETLSGSTVTDQSGNNHGATLYGNATYANDATKGQVLYLDGTTNTYLAFPKGFFDGRSNMTISMDIRPECDATYFFTLAIGLNNYKYLFLRTKAAQVRTAITTLSYGKEREVVTTGSFKSRWFNIKIVMEGHKMSMYIDNTLVDTTDYVRSISDLGTNLLGYLGKSFYSSDSYFKGYFDNVQVYNRALSYAEITNSLTSPSTSEEFRIYPVPFDKQLNISLNKPSNPCEISVFDASGHLLTSLISMENNVSLPTETYPSGIYLVKIIQGETCLTKTAIKK